MRSTSSGQDDDEGEPLLVVEFRDPEVAAALSKSVAVALRGVAAFTKVVNVSEQPLMLHAYGQILDSEMPLFVEDTQPATLDTIDVPTYTKKFSVMNDIPSGKEPIKSPARRSQDCFNCEGNHTLRDCTLPRDFNKINQRRNEMKQKAVRYHADEQERTPGQISGELRRALGLKKYQIPLHVYRMRLFGYPPGWLLNAKITHSGLSLFDSHGKEVREPEDENSANDNSKDEYDVKKILNFPGFNVPPSSKYIDESEKLGYPPFNEEDSKMTMLEKLAPRAAKAYRRKKMAQVKPEQQPGDVQITADMDIDDDECDLLNGNEHGSFMPPLPPESPPPVDLPPPPPPIDFPPLPPPIDLLPPPPPTDSLPSLPTKLPSTSPTELPQSPLNPSNESNAISSPIDLITNLEELPQCSSPSLDDLEAQKLTLMAALEEKGSSPCVDEVSLASNVTLDTTIENSLSDNKSCSTPKSNLNNSRQGEVRESDMGTPVLSFSPYSRLPSCDHFSKDICDVMNFENLPDSTGKYGKMSGIIKKVREAFTKIHQE